MTTRELQQNAHQTYRAATRSYRHARLTLTRQEIARETEQEIRQAIAEATAGAVAAVMGRNRGGAR